MKVKFIVNKTIEELINFVNKDENIRVFLLNGSRVNKYNIKKGNQMSLKVIKNKNLYYCKNSYLNKFFKKSNIFLILITFLIFFAISIFGEDDKLIDIFLFDYDKSTSFYSTDMNGPDTPFNYSKYPSINLFDGNFKTCWVVNGNGKNAELFLKLPDFNIETDKNSNEDNVSTTKSEDYNYSFILNIFSGYSKSEDLFFKNSRPKVIELSFYYGEGFYSETGMGLYALKLKQKVIIDIKDIFDIQSFKINLANINFKQLKETMDKVYKNSEPDIENRDIHTLLVKLKVIDVYKGSKYDDICISEIFLNNVFEYFDKSVESVNNNQNSKQNNFKINKKELNNIKNVFVGKNNHDLIVEFNDKYIIRYKSESSIIQLVDISKDKRWIIIIEIPEENVSGHVETKYSLIDLLTGKKVNSIFKKYTGIDITIGPIYFEDEERFKNKVIIYLNCWDSYRLILK